MRTTHTTNSERLSTAGLPDEARLEPRIHELGRARLASMDQQRRGFGQLRRQVSNRLMDWAMSDPNFKVQLFRFVDVFPTLSSPTQIHDVLVDYLNQPHVKLPPGLEMGLKAGSFWKGALAKTVASNIQRMAENFIAGKNPAEALSSLRQLWQNGIAFSVDLLGEACLSDAEADAYRSRYEELIEALSVEVQRWPSQLVLETDHLGTLPRANVSVKVSSLSAHLKVEDFDGCVDRLFESIRPILDLAGTRGVFVNFDMEQAAYKDLTLALFRRCCAEVNFPAGIAVQAYLRSGPEDAAELIEWSRNLGRQVTVRLIKGAYWDYEVVHAQQKGWAIPVWTNKADTDACFEQMTTQFLASTPRQADEGGVKLALGSHNVRSIVHAQAVMEALDLPPSALEYQLLHGMADDLRESLVADGLRVRSYLPVGEMIPGMAYLVRRLLENTSNESWLRGHHAQTTSLEDQLRAPRAIPRHSEFGNVTHDRGATPTVPSQPGNAGTPRNEVLPNQVRGLLPGIAGLAEGTPFRNEPERDFAQADQRGAFAEAITKSSRMTPVTFIEPAEAVDMIGRAAASRDNWAATSWLARSQCLIRAAAAFRDQRDRLAVEVIREAGKTWREADADVCEAIDFCEYYARLAAHRLQASTLGDFLAEANTLSYHPVGVAAVISPWNFPLAICTGMTVAALVCGNPVLVKPAEQTSRIADHMCQVLWQAGIPRDVLQFAPGQGETVGATLVDDPRVAMIAFTGSRAVGFQILSRAGRVTEGQSEIKRVVCEMGGKNAIIVDSTADLDEAVLGVAHSAFGYAGQKCSACSRVIVLKSHYEAFLNRLIEATRSMVVGDPMSPQTDIGPVIDEEAAEKIRHYIEIGRRENQLMLAVQVPAEIQQSVDRPLIGPHIFAGVQPDHTLAQEEIFGPVLAVMQADNFEDALAMANATVYKLTGAVYSRTPAHLAQARHGFHVGNLYLNRGSTGALVGRQPFGGFGHSGLGTKAGGPDYLQHFVYPRAICENTLRRGFAPGMA